MGRVFEMPRLITMTTLAILLPVYDIAFLLTSSSSSSSAD
jgi:hypothetical protein